MKNRIKRLIRLFGEEVLVVGRQDELESLVSKNVPQGIWLAWEVLLTKQLDDAMIKAIHQTKKTFPGAIIHAV